LLTPGYAKGYTGLELNKSFVWDPVFRRLRCNGHVINLSAQSFLFPNLSDKDNVIVLDAQINSQLPKEFNNAQMKLWRKKGLLGKLHNVSVYIAMSMQRLDAFRLISGNLRLPRDNSTRWNQCVQKYAVYFYHDRNTLQYLLIQYRDP
jgi:hypothetical protein